MMGCVFGRLDNQPGVFHVWNVDGAGRASRPGLLEVTPLQLVLHQGGVEVRWPLTALRRYGFEAHLFSFECGRRCATGAGVYAFRCRRAQHLFQLLQENINKGAAIVATPEELPPAPNDITLPTQIGVTPEDESGYLEPISSHPHRPTTPTRSPGGYVCIQRQSCICPRHVPPQHGGSISEPSDSPNHHPLDYQSMPSLNEPRRTIADGTPNTDNSIIPNCCECRSLREITVSGELHNKDIAQINNVSSTNHGAQFQKEQNVMPCVCSNGNNVLHSGLSPNSSTHCRCCQDPSATQANNRNFTGKIVENQKNVDELLTCKVCLASERPNALCIMHHYVNSCIGFEKDHVPSSSIADTHYYVNNPVRCVNCAASDRQFVDLNTNYAKLNDLMKQEQESVKQHFYVNVKPEKKNAEATVRQPHYENIQPEVTDDQVQEEGQVNYAVLDLDQTEATEGGPSVANSPTKSPEGYALIDFDRTVALSQSICPCPTFSDDSIRKTRHNAPCSSTTA